MLVVPVTLAPSTIHGIGVFAKCAIRRGAPVWVMHRDFDLRITEEQIASLPRAVRDALRAHCYRDREGLVLCGDEARYMNHAQDCNVGSVYPKCYDEVVALLSAAEVAVDSVDWAAGVCVALRDIEAGAELTCDYYEFDLDTRQKLGDNN